ncbi:MAG: OB-fold nucleic acid binding domain-containing protein, partial [Chloroflexota bacterium]|nr:OB-fold nucleic acid binding domain-containing protein [Chloroflexota bacterium]
LARGAIVQVRGVLAAPYGNLELRPGSDSDISSIGNGGLPDPVPLDSAGISEANEGTLATITATLVDIDRYSSGAFSLGVRDERGDTRVYVFAPIELDRSTLVRGPRIRVTGIVGQRASRTGAADGHRIWPRGQADIVVLGDGPGATPSPTDRPGGEPPDSKPPRVAIKAANPGRTVTIVGVVTSKAGVIDSEARRVTVQDRSGAILVRYPADTSPAGVGRVIRATGEVGTWYGTVQMETTTKPRLKGRLPVVPTVLRRPPHESDEWQLVSVTVRIEDIERDGDTWRAQASLGAGGDLPIVGLAGSGIAPDTLEPGRAARIVGIVRRAHPSATDQRFAIAPRSRKDIELGNLVTADDPEDDEDRDDDEAGIAIAETGGDDTTVLAATLGSLDGLTDRVVRVGGRLEAIEGPRLTLDDGTGRGTVRFADGVGPLDPELRVGEVVNATGRVRQRTGRPEVVVQAIADVRRAAALGERPPAELFAPRPTPPPDTALALGTEAASTPAPQAAASAFLPLVGISGLAGSSLLLLGSAALLAWRSRSSPLPPTPG